MTGAFESGARTLFHPSTRKAFDAGIQEAIITNGLLHEVISIKISLDYINFIGKVNRNLFISRLGDTINSEAPYLTIIVDYDINFHTTWHNIIDKVAPFGFMVLSFPVKIIFTGKIVDRNNDLDNDIIINIQINRLGDSLGSVVYGETLCNNCGKAINYKRLEALPGTLYCTKCMQYYEKGDYGYGKSH